MIPPLTPDARHRIATCMAATPGGIGAFSIMRGVWDVQAEPVMAGLVLLVMAGVLYTVITRGPR